jgi:hypothetical protein
MIEELDAHTPARHQAAVDAATHYRNIIGAFTETIRISDFKANVAIVIAAVMMGPVIGFRDKLPAFLPLNLALAPFLVAYFCLLICLYPRYGREGRVHFIIARNASPTLFPGPESEEIELEKLQTLCAILSRILYWKTLMLMISFYAALLTVGVALAIMIYQMLPLPK